mgnify:CR=1 FL=1
MTDAGTVLRPVMKRDGDAWVKSPRTQLAAELGTSPRTHLRAFASPRSNAIMYQAAPLSSAQRKLIRERAALGPRVCW